MNKPKYIAIAAITIDGKIAKGTDHFSNWTSKEDKIFMRALLSKSDVVIVGNNTYKTAIKPLSKRNCIVFTSSVNKPVQKSEKLMFLNPNKADIKKIIKYRKYKKIALLGGAQTYSYFLEKNLLDELYLTIEPIAFGGGVSLFSNKQLGDFKFKFIWLKKLNKKGSVLIKYSR